MGKEDIVTVDFFNRNHFFAAVLIKTCADFGASRKDTADRVAKSFSLTSDAAENYVCKYWK